MREKCTIGFDYIHDYGPVNPGPIFIVTQSHFKKELREPGCQINVGVNDLKKKIPLLLI